MAPVRNARVLFNEIPKDFPVPGKTTIYDTTQTIDPDTVPLNGGFLLKTLVLSIDPYQRVRMVEPTKKSYAPPFTIGQPIDNSGVSVVIRSENPEMQVGDHLYGFYPFAEYHVRSEAKSFRKLKNEEGLPWSVHIGAAGIPGKTAYYSWSEYSHAKEGDVVFVSGAAGAIGSLVVQLAKQQGLKVIASAGSEAKVDFLKSIGADVAFNYKTSSTSKVLEKEGPIDVYWDNVGGEILEAALEAANHGARFIECGMISEYSKGSGAGIRNMMHVFAKSITLYGVTVGRLEQKYEGEFYKTVPGNLARGELKYSEHKYKGLEAAGQALLDIQIGGNEGKSVIVVAEE